MAAISLMLRFESEFEYLMWVVSSQSCDIGLRLAWKGHCTICHGPKLAVTSAPNIGQKTDVVLLERQDWSWFQPWHRLVLIKPSKNLYINALIWLQSQVFSYFAMVGIPFTNNRKVVDWEATPSSMTWQIVSLLSAEPQSILPAQVPGKMIGTLSIIIILAMSSMMTLVWQFSLIK